MDFLYFPGFAFLFPGHLEWLILAVIALVLFGKRLPEAGRSLGQAWRQFKKGLNEDLDESDDGVANADEKGVSESSSSAVGDADSTDSNASSADPDSPEKAD